MRMALAVALVLLTATASADDEWGGVYNGRTLGAGGGMVYAAGGFPHAGIGALIGTSDSVDFGLKANFIYTGQRTYATDGFKPVAGFDPRLAARFSLASGRVLSALIRLEPGVRLAQFDPALRWGPELVFGIDFGIRVAKGASIYAGVEVPIFLNIPDDAAGNPFFVDIPILPGVGFEAHPNDFIGFGGRFNAGVDVSAGNITKSPQTTFAMLAEGFFVLRVDRIKSHEKPR